MEQETTAIVIFVIICAIFCKNYINIYKTDNSYTVSSLIFMALEVLSFLGTITNYEYFYLDFSGVFDIGNIAYGIGYNFFSIIALIIVIDKWKKISRSKIRNRIVYYTENCKEMENLIEIWQSENLDYKYRILDLDSYKKLKTDTAKIVFLFNLMLDMSDIYNDFRHYMNNISTINIDYIEKSNSFLTLYDKYLNVAYDLNNKLKDTLCFKEYENCIGKILKDFNALHKLIGKIQTKIQAQLLLGIDTKEIVNSLNMEIEALIKKTDLYANDLKELQCIIDYNDKVFSQLKILDSNKFETYV